MLKSAGLLAGITLVLGAWSPGTAMAAGDAEAGNSLYHTYCSVCHGPRMMNSGARADDLRKMKPSEMGKFKKVVKEGRRGPKGEMPSWADILTDQEIADLWAYVKTKGK